MKRSGFVKRRVSSLSGLCVFGVLELKTGGLASSYQERAYREIISWRAW